MILIGLSVSAILGVFLRYGIDSFFPITSPQIFPWHTFGINIVGSFLIGVVYVLASEKGIMGESWRLILTTGFLGSFTTFSAFSLQNLLLIQDGKLMLALTYSAGSVLVGLGAAFAAVLISRMMVG